jgi:hypothetical protein
LDPARALLKVFPGWIRDDGFKAINLGLLEALGQPSSRPGRRHAQARTVLSDLGLARIPRDQPGDGSDRESTREGGGTGKSTQSPLLIPCFSLFPLSAARASKDSAVRLGAWPRRLTAEISRG